MLLQIYLKVAPIKFKAALTICTKGNFYTNLLVKSFYKLSSSLSNSSGIIILGLASST